jgi:acyl-CoA dehydrogenase
MEFMPSGRVSLLQRKLSDFMAEHIYPNEGKVAQEISKQASDFRQWQPLSILEELKSKARAQGLWNLFLPDHELGAGLSNIEYAPLAEIMGRSYWASEVFNCDAPNTGNMEVLARYGTEAQKKQWLEPLLNGAIRSAFAMTEPAVASSDATNIQTEIRRDGASYVISGRKWLISGMGDPRCSVLIVMGQSNPDHPERHRRQSMILVPANAAGLKVRRYLPIFGLSHAPHGHMEVIFREVQVPRENMLLGEGRGFEIAQGRLGPGRIHHCMRLVGVAERALERTCRRLSSRIAFNRPLAEQSVWRQRIAMARCSIEQVRLLTLKAAWMMDTAGNKAAKAEIAMIKIVAPRMATELVDMAIQAFGGGGLADAILVNFYAYARALRLVDGPDEVHAHQLGRLELARHADDDGSRTGGRAEILVVGGNDYDVPST